jgi:predicted ATP-grasp superfamily ATP-dependent carboligase
VAGDSFEHEPVDAEPLTLVGASVRAAADSARRAGFAPIAADLFADVDLRQMAQANCVTDYPHGLEQTIRGAQAGPWMYTGALENEPALVERWTKLRMLLGNDASVLRQVRNPCLVADVLRRGGSTCPEVVTDATEIPRDGSWLRKPLRSAGGMQIVPWDDRARPHDRHVYFQQRVDGTPYSAIYVAANGKAILLGVTRQLLDGNSFRYAGSIGPCQLERLKQEEFDTIGNTVAGAFGLVGLFGVDCVINAHGVWPVEINPRYTSSVEVLERATGMTAIAMHVAACRNQQLPQRPLAKSTRILGKRILFAERDLIASVPRDYPDIADIPAPGTHICAGGPILTAFAEGDSEADVIRRLQRAVDDLQPFMSPCVLHG